MSAQHLQSPIASMFRAEPAIGRRTALSRAAIGIAAAGLILYCERIGPPALSMGCLYMLLAVYAAMRLRTIGGIVLLIGAVGLGGLIKHHQLAVIGRVDAGMIGIELWNGITRLVTICLFCIVLRRMLAALRIARVHADRDPLTGALNRRAFGERCALSRSRPATGQSAAALIYFDLDGFKAVNDRDGHATGDALLRRFVVSAAEGLRDGDHFGRAGGDEFVAMLVDRDTGALERRALALHARLHRALGETDSGITCSAGAVLTESLAPGEIDATIERADRLMYQVKQLGKNRLSIVHRWIEHPPPAYDGSARGRFAGASRSAA